MPGGASLSRRTLRLTHHLGENGVEHSTERNFVSDRAAADGFPEGATRNESRADKQLSWFAKRRLNRWRPLPRVCLQRTSHRFFRAGLRSVGSPWANR
jgi:hypothetical protein